tara:strand:- start:531 stop:1364 length:834 start_codon:yes stop_codon:yes gene_type:complete
MTSCNCATIILNRNNPRKTDLLVDHLKHFDACETDIYVLEAGSDPDKLSSYVTWHISSPEVTRDGLRFSRGMNQALLNIYNNKTLWSRYDYFFLLTNDICLKQQKTIAPLLKIFDEHPKLGILSPCGEDWGERNLIPSDSTKYVWTLFTNTLCIRKKFMELIINPSQHQGNRFLFDGDNFRGYLMDSELVAKAYANNFAVAVTTKVLFSKKETYSLDLPDLFDQEAYTDTLRLYISEGEEWLRRKYGFSSRWVMNSYIRHLFEQFFCYNDECIPYKI